MFLNRKIINRELFLTKRYANISSITIRFEPEQMEGLT